MSYISHDTFLPHPFQFITRYYQVIRICSLVRGVSFSQRCCRISESSGMLRCVVGQDSVKP